MRRWAVGILVAVSVLALILSSTSLWTRRHVVNTGVFVSTTQQVMQDKAVQARVTDQVVTAIMARPRVQTAINQTVQKLPPALQQFKPSIVNGVQSLLTTGVRTVLTSAAFDQVVRTALTNAHSQLVAGQDIRFSIGDAKAALPASAKSGVVGQILSLIPSNVGITVLQKSQAPQLYSALDLLKRLWLWLGLVAAGALAGALVVSHRRRRTLRAWAVWTGIGALILALGITVARPIVVGRAQPGGRDAVGAVYDIVANSLRAWTLWLFLIMVVLTVVVSLWGRLHVVSALRRAAAASRAAIGRGRRHAATTGAASTEVATADVTGPRPPWYRRFAVWVGAFVDGLDLPRRLSGTAAAINAGPAAWRWAGVVVGLLVLLIWPHPTLSVLLWTVAIVALYLGVLRLVQVVAARGGTVPGETTVGAAPSGDGGPSGDRTVAVAGAMPAGIAAGGTTEPGPVGGAAEPRSVGGASVPVPDRPRGVADIASPETRTLSGATGTGAGGTVDELVTTDARLTLLTRLGQARNDGLLTDAEFAREKVRLMDYQAPGDRFGPG